MERTRARNRPTHRPHRKHGEPPNSHMEFGRYGGALAASARKVVCSVKPVYYYTADFGKVLGAIARCFDREGLVDKLAFALEPSRR